MTVVVVVVALLMLAFLAALWMGMVTPISPDF